MNSVDITVLCCDERKLALLVGVNAHYLLLQRHDLVFTITAPSLATLAPTSRELPEHHLTLSEGCDQPPPSPRAALVLAAAAPAC